MRENSENEEAHPLHLLIFFSHGQYSKGRSGRHVQCQKAISNGGGNLFLATHCIDGYKAATERKQLEMFRGSRNFIGLCTHFILSQRQPRFCTPGIDHVDGIFTFVPGWTGVCETSLLWCQQTVEYYSSHLRRRGWRKPPISTALT